jgi:acetyl-CoA carboxylase biotin carboxyl carrier protein
VGDMVKKDDVLCLIEVMKQVTEVTAPQDGQVADICLNNGSVVEFGQTLMKLC